MTSVFAWLTGLIKGVAVNIAAFFSGAWWQREKQKRKDVEKNLKDIRDAKDIHKRVDVDDDYRERVRDKYR